MDAEKEREGKGSVVGISGLDDDNHSGHEGGKMSTWGKLEFLSKFLPQFLTNSSYNFYHNSLLPINPPSKSPPIHPTMLPLNPPTINISQMGDIAHKGSLQKQAYKAYSRD